MGMPEMHEACQGASNVPWLRPDLTKPPSPIGRDMQRHWLGELNSC